MLRSPSPASTAPVHECAQGIRASLHIIDTRDAVSTAA